MNVYEMADHVETRQQFIDFLQTLLEDLEDNPGEWENPDIGSFLFAMARWLQATDAASPDAMQPPANPWRMIAFLLIVGRGYE